MDSSAHPRIHHTETPEEHRGPSLLLTYWETLRGAKNFPSEEEIEPTALKDIWNDCFLIQRRDVEQVESYNYTYLGKNIVHAYESGELDTLIPGLVHLDAAHLGEEYRQVFTTGKPLYDEGEYPLNNRDVIHYRQCMVPLGNKDGVVCSILGKMTYRIYPVK